MRLITTVTLDYGLTFVYRVNLTAERSTSINHDNCSNNFCNATFVEIDGEIGTIKLSVLAVNELGSSELICYPYTIGKFTNNCNSDGSSVFYRFFGTTILHTSDVLYQ